MRKAKLLSATLLTLAAVVLVGDQVTKQSLRHADFQPLADLIKSRLVNAVMVPVQLPGDLKDQARLFDTYQRAFLLVRSVVDSGSVGDLPKSSTEINGLPPEKLIDGWGNPFCVINVDSRVAAVSSGATGVAWLSCSDLPLDLRELSSVPSGKLYRYPSGAIAYLAGARSSARVILHPTGLTYAETLGLISEG